MAWVIDLSTRDPCRFCTFLREIVVMHDIGTHVYFARVEIIREAGRSLLPSIHIYAAKRPGKRWTSPWDFRAEPIVSPWTILSIGSDVRQGVRNNFIPWKKAIDSLDTDLVKTWISECIQDHKESCSPIEELINDLEPPLLKDIGREQIKLFRRFKRRKSIPPKVVSRKAHPPDILRLIDVKSWRLHEAYSVGPGQVPRYVALSYVWGEGESKKLLEKNLMQWLEHGRLPRDLPRTILNAIELTSAMGEQYLWTDRLCIVQDDPKEMENTMQHMHGVYMNAVFTIIAVFGTHCEAGLKGYAPSQPWSSPVCSIRGKDFALGCVDPLYELRTSKWITRGWTLQEMVCSRRSLLLMGSSIALWCGKSTKHQDRWGVSDIPHSEWTRSLIPIPAHNRDHPIDSTGKTVDELSSTKYLVDLLKGYLARDLTSKSDFLNAFVGILSYMELDLGKHHFGLPTKIFENAIAWSGNSAISRGGLWQPSWSWVGWEFTKHKPSIDFPQGEAVLSIYRGDDLENPISTPNQHMKSMYAKDSRLKHFKPDKSAMEKALAQLQPSRHTTPYFAPHRLAQLQKEHPELSLYSLLGNHLLVFFTSYLPLNSGIVSMKKGRKHVPNVKMRLWDLCDRLTDTKLTSILLLDDIVPGLDPETSDAFIVIQKGSVVAGRNKQPFDGPGYRLMLIRTENGISNRLGVTEGCVDIQQWYTYLNLPAFRPRPKRELIILG
ncbi:heterokaryon incompatibility protein-domain-containing protein [Cadophora sp. MPI-SDFR-AT-0126]|nr:heterokaryon incompatibility protein-domain-containing protein [Leotiomycetes sp. MPI-SDFR-AT-0126]